MRASGSRVAAVGAAAFVLAGSAALAAPATAMAETKTVPCGGTVTAAPGDRIVGVTPLGLKLDLGIVTDGIGSLLSGVCKVTVKVVDTVVAPVPEVGEPVADAVGGAVEGTTRTAGEAVGTVTGALSGSGGTQPAPRNPAPGQPAPATPPDQQRQPGPSGPAQSGNRQAGMPAPNSPVLGGSALPGAAWLGYTTGWAPMRDYTGLPMATPGLFSVSPGVRYGGQIPGYSPEFGILGADDGGSGRGDGDGVRNAGSADALPSGSGDAADGATLPLLLAVLTLSGVTAALVRTWVLRTNH
ncbi:hypothetical protein [Prauserella muralis]|uniref:Uncharacterized protein n=1 Tax=Prauserella muralis TaxID=588067 RepID=A0A2V4BLV2_9PSEU|nr:hypothetical protein [Prauserella muralis]PXY31623.1 hypothetical protein BAY60_04450 [Prauserella muralis]TWE14012.1 hypothetical protein FHX69_6146 [Prauserella muralis]